MFQVFQDFIYEIAFNWSGNNGIKFGIKITYRYNGKGKISAYEWKQWLEFYWEGEKDKINFSSLRRQPKRIKQKIILPDKTAGTTAEKYLTLFCRILFRDNFLSNPLIFRQHVSQQVMHVDRPPLISPKGSNLKHLFGLPRLDEEFRN